MNLHPLLPILIEDKWEGKLYPLVRDALFITFHHYQDMTSIGTILQDIQDEFITLWAKDNLQYYLGTNGGYPKKISQSTLTRLRNQYTNERWKNAAYGHSLFDHKEGKSPRYRVEVSNRHLRHEGKLINSDHEDNFIEFRLPSELLETDQRETLIDWICSIGDRLDYNYGYASIGLSWADTGYDPDYLCEYTPFYLLRYPGLGTGENQRIWSPRNKVPSAFWLTFVGPGVFDELGGSDKLRASLPDAIQTKNVGNGLMIRTDELPQLGDLEKDDMPKNLQTLAHVLEPVTAFNMTPNWLLSCYGVDNINDESKGEQIKAQWERRWWR